VDGVVKANSFNGTETVEWTQQPLISPINYLPELFLKKTRRMICGHKAK
jgi:hypothetical protein